MKKIFSILMLLTLTTPFLMVQETYGKGEFKKELKEAGDEVDETTVLAIKIALYVAIGLAIICIIIPGTRRIGFALAIGVFLALGAIVLFTEWFSSPMTDLSKKKKMEDFFDKGSN